MCQHDEVQNIEEEVQEERWEGDTLVQELYDWVFCPVCGEDLKIPLAR